MSDRTHLRPLSPAKRIAQLEDALEQTRAELAETKAILGDCLEERGLPREPAAQYLFFSGFLSFYDAYLVLVIQASSQEEADEQVRAYGAENFPAEDGWEGATAERVADQPRSGIWAIGGENL